MLSRTGTSTQKSSTMSREGAEDFDDALDFALRWEGGLSDDPDDPGGLTNFGIALKKHPHLRREDILNMTREKAAVIYRQEYWNPIGAGELPWPLNVAVFDAAVNMGVPRALKFLERALKANKGPKERAQIVCNVRRAYYAHLVYKRPKWAKYIKGWLNRVSSLERLIAQA